VHVPLTILVGKPVLAIEDKNGRSTYSVEVVRCIALLLLLLLHGDNRQT
jgi:hypothetical protein